MDQSHFEDVTHYTWLQAWCPSSKTPFERLDHKLIAHRSNHFGGSEASNPSVTVTETKLNNNDHIKYCHIYSKSGVCTDDQKSTTVYRVAYICQANYNQKKKEEDFENIMQTKKLLLKGN